MIFRVVPKTSNLYKYSDFMYVIFIPSIYYQLRLKFKT